MIPEAQRLHAALVAAFPDYATEVAAARGDPMDRDFVVSVERASVYLDGELARLLDEPFGDQRRSPLEVFRDALGLVTGISQGRRVPRVDEWGGSGRGGSQPDPLPGSPAVLGPEAHAAHLAWGAAKATALTTRGSTVPSRPVVLLLSGDGEERSDVPPRLEAVGFSCRVVRNPGAVAEAIDDGGVVAAAVDLAHPASIDVVERLTGAGVVTVVYDDAPDDLIGAGLRAAGVRAVLRRRDFVDDPGRFLPGIV